MQLQLGQHLLLLLDWDLSVLSYLFHEQIHLVNPFQYIFFQRFQQFHNISPY